MNKLEYEMALAQTLQYDNWTFAAPVYFKQRQICKVLHIKALIKKLKSPRVN